MSDISVRDLYTVGESVTLTQLTKLLGVTSNKIKGLIAHGLPHVVNGNTTIFDTVEASKWIINYEINQGLNVDEERMDVYEAKRRGEVAKTLMAELMLAKEREQLANIEDLMVNFTSALIQVRAKLVSQPSRISGLLTHQEQKEIIKILESDTNDILETLSEYKHEYIEYEPRSKEDNERKNIVSVPSMPKATTKT